MRTKIVVAALVAALAVYFVFLTQRALDLIATGGIVPVGLGIGVLLLPVIGVVVVVFELRFGAATGRLARRLTREGGLPDPGDLPRRPSGRVERAAADAWFETVKARVEADPQSWQQWYALAQAYDLAGDRRRARAAMRRSIALEAAASPEG
ncbi:hypothetical protein [Nakamurella endophytica]|uniref:Membrane protein n=1 Tax=Nakamurella endophytica TaxID=1748367 RepID=A0A917SSK7_9ACTN|nr:hypothetical protein [Nakamurella endophytica]GGL95416.1 membrane protein [Nakamurella endophytica]